MGERRTPRKSPRKCQMACGRLIHGGITNAIRSHGHGGRFRSTDLLVEQHGVVVLSQHNDRRMRTDFQAVSAHVQDARAAPK